MVDSFYVDPVLKSDETSQLVVRRGPNPEAATYDKNTIEDWDSVLHSLWLEKMAVNPGFYSDSKGGT